MDYSEYRDLMPVDNIENGNEYINALTWAFNNKKIKNIALAGPYGSGKSSIIETFLRNRGFSKNFLKVSLASFAEGHQESDNVKRIELSSDEIEKGILKQLFYKVEPQKIPQSRYRKLTAKKLPPFFFSYLRLQYLLDYWGLFLPLQPMTILSTHFNALYKKTCLGLYLHMS